MGKRTATPGIDAVLAMTDAEVGIAMTRNAMGVEGPSMVKTATPDRKSECCACLNEARISAIESYIRKQGFRG